MKSDICNHAITTPYFYDQYLKVLRRNLTDCYSLVDHYASMLICSSLMGLLVAFLTIRDDFVTCCKVQLLFLNVKHPILQGPVWHEQ